MAKTCRTGQRSKLGFFFFHCLFCFLYITESLINFLSTAVCFISIGHLVLMIWLFILCIRVLARQILALSKISKK